MSSKRGKDYRQPPAAVKISSNYVITTYQVQDTNLGSVGWRKNEDHAST